MCSIRVVPGWRPARLVAARERWRTAFHAVLETRQQIADARTELTAQIEASSTAQRAESARLREILRSIADREPLQRERLRELRASDEYMTAFVEAEPLVSVVIPTYDQPRLLRERSIPSVLAQTYQRVEVVVVGDAASDEVRSAVESFSDARVRFANLTQRGPYPEDALARWLVAGVAPYNEAVRLAHGRWIAPLDDDDAFRPGHIEQLLATAQQGGVELVYGKLLKHLPDGGGEVLGRFPPELGQFGLQSVMYHAGLADIFDLELTDCLFDLPYDWGLCQRMLRAGVRMGMVDAISVDYYPSQSWQSRDDVSVASPEWEFVPDGWELTRREDQLCSRGWDVEEVAQAYLEKWPAFCEAISGSRPLGVAHEVGSGAAMSNDSLVAHNTAMTLAYVLARTGPADGPLTVLDWGGGLGHQHEIARSVLPQTVFDWHTRELPAVCREGKRVSPLVTFHESDECLESHYDLVLASSSLQYAEDWRELLRQLARAADGSLFITRVPLAQSQPSFVVLQRAQAYGYATEYVGWVFNRSELLDEVAAAGLELVREFFLQEPMHIAGAPEGPSHGGFLFERSSASE
jgi:putative methyltransferase (TIGR04325 family)